MIAIYVKPLTQFTIAPQLIHSLQITPQNLYSSVPLKSHHLQESVQNFPTQFRASMLDPRTDLLPPPSSPTASSISSSDLDTESTGSFFHDRSTTLGTLMGVNFPGFRAPSRSHSRRRQITAVDGGGDVLGGVSRRNKKAKKKKADVNMGEEDRPRWRRRRWWRLCRDEEDCRAVSLGEYLEVERRFGDVAVFGGGAAVGIEDAQPRNGRVLFAEGRVLPPVEVDGDSSETGGGGSVCGFYVGSFAAICR